MNLDRFSIPKEVFVIFNSINRYDEQGILMCAVMHYIYDNNEEYARNLRSQRALIAFQRIKDIIDKPLARARKAKARREERKAHPEKYPPRPRKSARRAGAVELPSGHVIESDTPQFDYYCIKGNKILYFRMIGYGDVEGQKASFTSAFDPTKAVNAILNQPPIPDKRRITGFQAFR